jgi:nitroreductase
MEVFECIQKRNSIRRFTQDPILVEDLTKIIDAVRISPSAANLQPLEFIIINEKEKCDEIFPQTFWASYLIPPWKPDLGERPTAYISIINNQPENSYVDFDIGISMAYIVLAAQALQLGSCILYKINRKNLKKILKIPDSIQLKALVALGYKNETVKREENFKEVKYWRDENEIFHVPKKPLSYIIHKQQYARL